MMLIIKYCLAFITLSYLYHSTVMNIEIIISSDVKISNLRHKNVIINCKQTVPRVLNA